MKKMKKSLVALGAILVIGTGGGVIASQVLNWGGEDNIDEIYQAVDALDSQLTVKKRDLATAKSEARSTKNELEKAKENHKNALAELNSINSEMKGHVETLAVLQEDLKATKAQVGERDVLLQEKQDKLNDYVALLTQYSENNKQTLIDAQERIDAAEATINELEQELTSKQEQTKLAYTQVETLTQEKQSLETENTSLRESNSDTQAKLDKALNDVAQLQAYAENKVYEQEHTSVETNDETETTINE